VVIRLGTGGSPETTGYSGNTVQLTDATAIVGNSHNASNGIVTDGGQNAAAVRHGTIVLTLQNTSTNTWVSSVNAGRSDSSSASCGGGSKSLAGVLDMIRLTSVGAVDTFDAGSLNIIYE